MLRRKGETRPQTMPESKAALRQAKPTREGSHFGLLAGIDHAPLQNATNLLKALNLSLLTPAFCVYSVSPLPDDRWQSSLPCPVRYRAVQL